MRYIVKSLSINGNGKVFRSGDEVNENNFKPGLFHKLISSGHIIVETCKPTYIEPVPRVGNRIRIVISTGIWGRFDVFEMFAKGVKKLMHEFPHVEFITVVAGSEGKLSENVVKSHGFTYIEVANNPLAAKFNATTLAAKSLSADYVLCMGSDDVIHPSLMELYIKYINEGYDYMGILDMYFWDTISNKCLYWGGYTDARRLNHTAGAGRVISARLMGKWGWTPWENRHSKVLDNSMQEKLTKVPHSAKLINIKTEGVYALDIKSDVNMTPFSVWPNSEIIPNDILNKFNYILCAESAQ